MSDNDKALSMYEVANRFIDLANELTKLDQSGTVGTAIRYAAARYNAFEASQQTDDLVRDKEKMLEMFCNDYRKMMDGNLDEYAAHLSQN